MATNKMITVTNEFGKEVELEVIDALKIGEDKYVIVSEKGSESANAYKEIGRDTQIEYASIGAGAEFKKVLEAYNSKHS